MTIYNPGPYLGVAIDSLFAQTFVDFELIAIENGSTDGAKQLMRHYAERDSRVRLFDLDDNIGRTAALNLALNSAVGEYIAILDADDVASPVRFSCQVELLDAFPDVVLVASHARFIDTKDRVIGLWEPEFDESKLVDSFAYSNPIAHSTAMYRRNVAIGVGGYPLQFIYAQDFAMWLRMLPIGRVYMIASKLADIRQHGSQASTSITYRDRRHTERLELFRCALRTLTLSDKARQSGLINIARIHLTFASDLTRSGHYLFAFYHVIRAIITAPARSMYEIILFLGIRRSG